MEVLGLLVTAAQTLVEVVQAARSNKDQCRLLADRVQRLVAEFKRLPAPAVEALTKRGVLGNLLNTIIRSVTDAKVAEPLPVLCSLVVYGFG